MQDFLVMNYVISEEQLQGSQIHAEQSNSLQGTITITHIKYLYK